MRSRFALGFALLALALLAWWLASTHARPARVEAQPVSVRGLPLEAPVPELVDAPASGASETSTRQRSSSRELRFEPLPAQPAEVLIHVRDGRTHEPLVGAEVFALEVQEWDWPFDKLSEGEPTPDVEALLRERGQRSLSDEHGEVRIAWPREALVAMARKDGSFGERCGSYGEAEIELDLHESPECLVRMRTRSGRPAARVAFSLSSTSSGSIWHGVSDEAGEARIPNIGWLLHERGSDGDAWCVEVNDLCAAPPAKWFQKSEPLPAAIEIELPDALGLRLRVLASDGTPVPIHGRIEPHPRDWGGSASRMHLRRRTFPVVALVDGEARLGRSEPGGWLDAEVFPAGDVEFDRTLCLPASESEGTTLELRMPESMQVLLLRPTDERGCSFPQRDFEWVRWPQDPRGMIEVVRSAVPLRSDARGLVVLAIERPDLETDGVEESDRDDSTTRMGLLRLCEGGREMESAPIRLSSIGRGAVRDLGAIALKPAAPIVRGQVVDENGKPLPHVSVRLEQLQPGSELLPSADIESVDTGLEAVTDPAGAFRIEGDCPSGRLRLVACREGYSPPAEARDSVFERGSHPELTLHLARNGAVRTSVIMPRRLTRALVWTLESDDTYEDIDLDWPPAPGLVEHDLEDLRPGAYRVRLVSKDSTEPPIVVAENVIVKPGMITLDPRLLEIDLSAFAAHAGTPEDETPGVPAVPVVLHVLDNTGKPILAGVVERYGTDVEQRTEWHGNSVDISDFPEHAQICVWSPGFRAFAGNRPKSSRDVRLEPAWQTSLRVEIPAAMRKPDRRYSVRPSLSVDTRETPWVAREMPPAAVGVDGIVSFECPIECDFDFTLEVVPLVPGTLTSVEDAESIEVTHVQLHVPTSGATHVLSATAEEWAEAEKALGEKR